MSGSRRGAEPPSVFGFDDYREFLRAWFLHRKRHGRRYSFGVFARRAGILSRSHLKLAMDGRRNLGREMVEKYVKGLGLAGEEAAFFRALVRRGQARSPEERETARAEVARRRKLHDTRRLGQDEAHAFSRQWEAVMVLGMTALKGFRADPAWIERRSGGRIPRAAARQALRWLKEQGYLVERRGRTRGKGEHGTLESPEIPRESVGKVLRWLSRQLAASDRPRGYGDMDVFLTVITPSEAEALRRSYWRWLRESLPDRPRRPVDGELCAVVGDILPLTRGPGR